jgi:hypothetical protein
MEPITQAHAALEVAKNVSQLPFTSVIKAILGPAAEELGQRVQDSVRAYRYGRQLKLLAKTEKMAKDAGFTPKAVPIKLLFPLLEGASLEEDENLHTMWAALLANAANPDTPELVHPSFIGTLKQLSPDDAKALEEGFEEHGERVKLRASDVPIWRVLWQHRFVHPKTAERKAPSDKISDDEALTLANLMSLFLIERRYSNPSNMFLLTPRGYQFVLACRAPMTEINESSKHPNL